LNFFLKGVLVAPRETLLSLGEEINTLLLRVSSCFKRCLEMFSKENTSSSTSDLVYITVTKFSNFEERI